MQLRSASACASTSRRCPRKTPRATSSTASKSPARKGRAIFAPEIYPLIYRYTGGIPRLDQHAVRHGDDGGVRAGPRRRSGSRTCRRRSTSCSGSSIRRRRRPNAPATTTPPPHMQPPVGRLILAAAGCGGHGVAAGAGPIHHRPHAGQRPADRQQVHQPPSRADHHDARRSSIEDLNSTNGIYVRGRARATLDAQRRRRRPDRPARDHVFDERIACARTSAERGARPASSSRRGELSTHDVCRAIGRRRRHARRRVRPSCDAYRPSTAVIRQCGGPASIEATRHDAQHLQQDRGRELLDPSSGTTG